MRYAEGCERGSLYWLWLILLLNSGSALAAQSGSLTPPLSLNTVKHMAREHSDEIVAARASAVAAQERAALVSSLEDPMLMTSIDHYPYKSMAQGDPMDPMSETPDNGRFDWSVAIEQRFPLSRERRFRRLSAEAKAQVQMAAADEVALEIEAQAAQAFAMLWENRRMQEVVNQQIGLAEQLVQAASARFSAARGGQTDLLRAEVELARLRADALALQAEEAGATAMLNARMGRDIDAQVPPLATPEFMANIPAASEVLNRATAKRPELAAGDAEVKGAEAEVRLMRTMYKPMAVLRLGTASTMAEGDGAMVMVGISLPIWRDKLRAGVAEAHAMEAMAKADRAAMQRMVEGEALTARAQLLAAQERYRALSMDVLPRARATLSPAMAGYSSGTASLPIVIDAAQAQWMAEAELAMAESRLIIARAQLERVMAWGGERED